MEIPILVLAGAPYERGHSHGAYFRHELASVVTQDFAAFSRSELLAAKQRAIATFDAIRVASPETAQEIEGIAAGARLPLQDVVVRIGFELFKISSGNGCSAVCLKSNTGAIVAQNWDAPVHRHPELALFLHFSELGFEFATIGSIGGLGWVGINRHGLAMVNNDLILDGYGDGVPSQVVRRIMLTMRDVRSAADAITPIQHMGGRSYLLGDRAGDICAIEVSAKSGTHFLPPADVHLHTNNALLPPTQNEECLDALSAIYPSSASRLVALENGLARGCLDVQGMKRLLCDETGAPNAVCKTASTDEPTETAFSIIMDCGRGELHFTSGKPSLDSYRKIVLPTDISLQLEPKTSEKERHTALTTVNKKCRFKNPRSEGM